MPAVEFEWDDANEEHIGAHGLEPDEVEEALTDPMRAPANAYQVPGERRRAVLCRTDNGRLLFVVYTMRGGRLRVVTARDATDLERRQYRRRNRGRL